MPALRSPFRRPRPTGRSPRRRSQRGQVLVIVVVMAIIFLVMALFMFDLQNMVRTRSKTQTGADAAALAGATWQGRSLNMIGELNLLKASTMMYAAFPVPGDTPDERFEASMMLLSEMQARITYVGPLLGYASAQQAAKANQMRTNGEYNSLLADHASTVENYYPFVFQGSTNGYTWIQPYADMLYEISAQGVAAKPTNSDYMIQPPLLLGQYAYLLSNPDFYDAVHARYWCWFLWNQGLSADGDFNFDDIEIRLVTNQHLGSEFLPLYVDIPELRSEPDYNAMGDFLTERGLSQIPPDSNGDLPVVEWATYNYRWDDTSLYESFNTARYLRSNFKSEYMGDGAASRFMVNAQPSLITGRWTWEHGQDPNSAANTSLGDRDALGYTDSRARLNRAERAYEEERAGDGVLSVASAKPFGSLGDERASAAGIVLPVFTDVRLLPVSLVTETQADRYPTFYKFLTEYFGHPDYPDVPDTVTAKWSYYISAIEQFTDPTSNFRIGLLDYEDYRQSIILGPDGVAGTDDDGRDPCEPIPSPHVWPPPGGGGGSHTGGGPSRGGPPSLH